MTTLEIAVTTLEDAIAAQEGGADSIELSVELERDGLTPPMDLVQAVQDTLTIEVHVIVRPHDRDFVYSEEEMVSILADTQKMVQAGVDGIVFGAQTSEGKLDIPAIRAVVNATKPLVFTLHRAIDSSNQPESALEQLQHVIDRVLTSGPAANAWDGRQGLCEWQQRFGDYVKFIAAGGVKANMLPDLVTISGVSGIHVGSGAKENGVVTAAKVREIKQLIN